MPDGWGCGGPCADFHKSKQASSISVSGRVRKSDSWPDAAPNLVLAILLFL